MNETLKTLMEAYAPIKRSRYRKIFFSRYWKPESMLPAEWECSQQ